MNAPRVATPRHAPLHLAPQRNASQVSRDTSRHYPLLGQTTAPADPKGMAPDRVAGDQHATAARLADGARAAEPAQVSYWAVVQCESQREHAVRLLLMRHGFTTY